MTIATQNMAVKNEAPGNVPAEHTPREMEVIAARLPVQPSKEPLLSSSTRQSPRLGNKGQLTTETIERSRWNLNRFPRISRSLLSNAFHDILRLTAIIPSKVFSRMDLPLFRRRSKPGRGFNKSGNTISDGPQAMAVLRTHETLINVPLPTSGNKGEGERLSPVSDEFYPAVIRRLFPLPALFDRAMDDSYTAGPPEGAVSSPSLALRLSHGEHTKAEDNPLNANDSQQKLDASNRRFSTSGQQTKPSGIKAGLSQPIISRQCLQQVDDDRTLSRLLNPFKPGMFRTQETAERDLPADSISESLETPKGGKSTIYLTNRHEKPIGAMLAGKRKSIPIKLPLLKRFELSGRFSPLYDQVSEQPIDREQITSTSTKPDTKPIFSSDKNNITLPAPISRKIPPSVPLSQDILEEPPSRSSQKVEYREAVVDDHEQNKHAMTHQEQTIFSETETKPRSLTKRHTPTLHKTISRNIGQLAKPRILNSLDGLSLKALPFQIELSSKAVPADDNVDRYPVVSSADLSLSKTRMPLDAMFEQDNAGIDSEDARKSGRSSMPGRINNDGAKSLNLTQLEKTVISGETPASHEVISRSLADGEQSSYLQPVAEPAVKQKQPLPSIGKASSGKAIQPAIPQSQGIIAGQPLKFRPYQRIELPAEVANDSYQSMLPAKAAGTSASPMSEAAASTGLNQNDATETQTITEKTSGPFIPLSQNILNRQLSKSLASHQGVRLVARHIGFEWGNFRGHKLIHQPAVNQTGYKSEAMSARKEIIKNPSDSDTPSAVIHDVATIAKSFLMNNKSDVLFNLKTRALNNVFTGPYPIIGNTFRSLKYVPQAITGEDSVIPAGAEKTASPLHLKYTNQPSLDLPVVSEQQPKIDTRPVHAEKYFRSLSDTHPELMMSSPSHLAPDLPPTSVRRIVEPLPPSQTIVNQAQSDKKSNKEATQDIRIIAEKVYAILKHELKIERARERHHLLR